MTSNLQLTYDGLSSSHDPWDDLWNETRGKELRDNDPDYEEDEED